MPNPQRNRRTSDPDNPREPSKSPKPNSARLRVLLKVINIPRNKALTGKDVWKLMGSPQGSNGKPLSTISSDITKLLGDGVIYEVPEFKPRRVYGIHCGGDWEPPVEKQRSGMWDLFTDKQKSEYWRARGVSTIPEGPPMRPTSKEAREKTYKIFLGLLHARGIYYPPEEIGRRMGISAQHASTNLGTMARAGELIRKKLKDSRSDREIWHYALPSKEDAGVSPEDLKKTPLEELLEEIPEPTPEELELLRKGKLDSLIAAHMRQKMQLKRHLSNVEATIRILRRLRDSEVDLTDLVL